MSWDIQKIKAREAQRKNENKEKLKSLRHVLRTVNGLDPRAKTYINAVTEELLRNQIFVQNLQDYIKTLTSVNQELVRQLEILNLSLMTIQSANDDAKSLEKQK